LGDEVAELTRANRPIWSALEAESNGGSADDARQWVSVYTNLLALLDKGAAVSIGDRSGNDLVGVDLEEVRERLDFWQSRLGGAAAG
jgi:hypothetical protein